MSFSFSFPSRSVVAVLGDVAAIYGYPGYLRIGNDSELTSKIMQLWAEERCVELLFIQPGKPTQNAFIESFNACVRCEILNAQRFRTLHEAQAESRAYVRRYSTSHSHGALSYQTPEEFLEGLRRNYHTSTEIRGRMTGPRSATRRFYSLDEPAIGLLAQAAAKLQFSARALDRIARVARTIADLGGAEGTGAEHVA